MNKRSLFAMAACMMACCFSGCEKTESAPEQEMTEEEKEYAERARQAEERFAEKISSDIRNLYKLSSEDKWEEMLKGAQKILDTIDASDRHAGSAWNCLCVSLYKSGRIEQYDDMFFKYAAGKFAGNVHFFADADYWSNIPGYGFIVNNQFKRGIQRDKNKIACMIYEQDRILVLSLMAPLIPEAEKADPVTRYDFFFKLANMLLQNRKSGSSYKLQELTDLTSLPSDIIFTDELYAIANKGPSYPPVNEDGSPVFYKLPDGWDAAANDGERLRFAAEKLKDGRPGGEAVPQDPLASATRKKALMPQPEKKTKENYDGNEYELPVIAPSISSYPWADFLCGQFDFLTMKQALRDKHYATPAMKQILYDLKDNETIAELANGVSRVTLPDDCNYIELYKKAGAHKRLAEIYSGRMQFEKAAEEFKKAGMDSYADDLTGKHGKIHFRSTIASPGTEVLIPFDFRNAKKVSVNLYRADVAKATAHMLEKLKTSEEDVVNVWDIGKGKEDKGKTWYNFINKTPEKILTFDLQPLPHHWETHTELDLGKLPPGAFLAEFVLDDEKKPCARTMFWTAEYALTVQTNAGNGKIRLFLNDQTTGKPVPETKLKIHSRYFLYDYWDNKLTGTESDDHTFQTDANGIVEFSPGIFKYYNYAGIRLRRFVIAETAGKPTIIRVDRKLEDNFTGSHPDKEWRAFLITDKTVYKPGDNIAVAGYIRQPSYLAGEICGDKTIKVTLTPPQGSRIEMNVPFDKASQSFAFETKLPADAALGQWNIKVGTPYYHLCDSCRELTFTVEEYKKPEYRLKVLPPSERVKAGEKVPVTIEAKYYFGAPMANTKILYKVFRKETEKTAPFDFPWAWLYGSSYVLCSTSFHNQSWGWTYRTERQLILEEEGKTDANGKLTIQLFSGDAPGLHGDDDFRYTVEAEVKDSTNHVVHGSGSFIASNTPFHLFLHVPWGFAKKGKRQIVEIAVRTPDGKRIKGTGRLRIYRKSLDQYNRPIRAEVPVQTINFIPDYSDLVEFTVNEEGAYEMEAEVISAEGAKEKISESFAVIGEKQGNQLLCTDDISISTDKATYQPGETAEILVACSKPGRTIYFITRTERDSVIQCTTLDGYSKLFYVPVKKSDYPNFYVDVMSYWDGKVHSLRKEIFVPPEKKVLNVTVKPAAEKIKPGGTMPVKIKVTDLKGKPVSGNIAVTVYDKSLEAICQSPVQPVFPFFWDWKRITRLGFDNCPCSELFVWHEMVHNIESEFSIKFDNDEGFNEIFHALGLKRQYAEALKSYGSGIDNTTAGNSKPSYKNPADNAKKLSLDNIIPKCEVRTDFRDRIFWAGQMTLPKSGETEIKVPVPDNMTTWVVRVWGLTADTKVGEARTEFIVCKDLIARLELPRFMHQGDTVNAVVTIHNTSSEDLGAVKTVLKAPGLLNEDHKQDVVPQKKDSVSYEVPLTAKDVGEYTLTLFAGSGKRSDGMQLKLPVLVKGIDKQVNSCGRLDRKHKKAVIWLDVPKARRPETTGFALYLSPGAAKNVIEILPYLVEDRSENIFSCINVFLPALSAKMALQHLGLEWDDNLFKQATENSRYAKYMPHSEFRKRNLSAEDFNRAVEKSLSMIPKMVNSDGGWGWFAGGKKSYPDTTACVVDALLEVQDRVDRTLIMRGIAWLEQYAEKRVKEIEEEKKNVNNTDCLIVRILSKADKPNKKLRQLCFKDYAKELSPYGCAMLALTYEKETKQAKELFKNLNQYLKMDYENNTAYLDIPHGYGYFWYGSEIETLAAYLELLLRNDPKGIRTQMIANYLVTNVRNSPRDKSNRPLGAAVRALAKYIMASGEDKTDFTVTVRTGKKKHKFTYNAKNMWTNDGPALFLSADQLKTGKQFIQLEFSGNGALYWNGMLNYFSLEDKIEPAGLEMKIQRNYYLLEQAKGTGNPSRSPLKDGDIVKPGDLIEVELISTSKNTYDYVVFEDSMPAGFEYENPESGWVNGTISMYAEYRERGVKFYLRTMPRGQCRAVYKIRAQLCGTVTALPAKGYGLYAPELKCNGAQQTMQTVK